LIGVCIVEVVFNSILIGLFGPQMLGRQWRGLKNNFISICSDQ